MSSSGPNAAVIWQAPIRIRPSVVGSETASFCAPRSPQLSNDHGYNQEAQIPETRLQGFQRSL